jgi:hypothetical protein
MGRGSEASATLELGAEFLAVDACAELSDSSSHEGTPTEKDESQKLQARTLDGNIAPHCEHVFVTG